MTGVRTQTLPADLMAQLRQSRVLRRWQPGWYVALAGVVLLTAFWLRFYDLGHNPPELLEDELAGAVSAWSVATTGHDVEETWLPFLPTRLELKQPIYYISTLPTQALLGQQSALGVRLPAVGFGLASTLLILWLMRVLDQGRAEALVAAALFATVPLAVHYGRIGWEPASLIAPTAGGMGLLWAGLERPRTGLIVGAGAVLALGAYTYHPALLMNLLLAVVVVALHARDLNRSTVTALALSVGVALLLLLPYLYALVGEPLFTARTRSVSVFADRGVRDAIGLAWGNYWQQWNPQWLFLSPVRNLRYHPNVPILFAWMAPFLVLGIVRLIQRRSRADVFLLAWMVVGPIPAALTNDGVPHFSRGLLALPPIVMVTSDGLLWCGRWVWRRAPRKWVAAMLVSACGVVIAGSAVAAYRTYYRDYPNQLSPDWHESPAAALRLAGEVVPSGGVLCIDATNGVSYWTFLHTITYYLADRDFEVIEDLADPRCWEPDSYLLYGLLHNSSIERVPVPVRLIERIDDRRGRPMFLIMQVAAR